MRLVVAGYFQATGMGASTGRVFDDADMTGPGDIVILNDAAARRIFPNEAAVGRTFLSGRRTVKVVGVVPDVRLWGPASRPEPAVFELLTLTRLAKTPVPLTIVVRPSADAPPLADAMRRAAESIGPPVVIDGVRRGSDWLSDRLARPRQRTALLAMLGGLGLLLALVGVIGLTSYAVTRRTHEIGVRLALGARPAQVVGAILWDAAGPIAGGVVIGLGAAALSTRLMQSLLFDTSPTDPATLAAVAAALALAAGAAAWLPARRAAQVDPVRTLGTE